MSFEIEKKYFVTNFDETLKRLKSDFGRFFISEKCGFWWTDNYEGSESILEVNRPVILRKDVELLKELGDFVLPEQDFQFLRLRVVNNKIFKVTFKTIVLVNNVEQNTEYEFEVELEEFKKIVRYLQERFHIFYYNTKKSWVFKQKFLRIELSRLNDLNNAYIEFEVKGNNKKLLTYKLNEAMKLFKDYTLLEESANYVELSRQENRVSLKSKKLKDYSNEGLDILQALLKEHDKKDEE